MAKLYDEVKKVAVHLARLDGSAVAEIKKSAERDRFEEMYWALLIGVEGPSVESAMVRLRRHFENWADGGKKPVGGDATTDVYQASLELSEACASELSAIEARIDSLTEQVTTLTAPLR
jgi:hypothetical protein